MTLPVGSLRLGANLNTMEKNYESPNYRTTDDLLSGYVLIFPACAATAA
jgi:hypothetical protein